ncbi:amidohydrolase family protein [Halostella salina]|uniref:amidohydrolase family protein n=1 Tax=Halostella salina TaxID=1547897 RepID=UPI000EF847A5|nr:amidohydrolase family protein [Halostella salina]
MPDLIVRDAYLADRDAVVDIAVESGRIAAIAPAVDATAPTEVDADGGLVSPGLVDSHVHLDMAESASDGRRPRNNDGGFDRDDVIRKTASYFEATDPATIRSTVRSVGAEAVANGVLHVRTHAYVDGTVGSDVVRAVLDAREELADLLDIEVVAFPQRGIGRDAGSEAAVRAALDAGADIVGGLDPVTRNDDRAGTVRRWFDIARDHDADLDVHVHEPGETGLRTLEHVAKQAVERDHRDRVTASHAYALADSEPDRLEALFDTFDEAGLSLVTCYQSTPDGMPLREAHEAGLTLAHGTDQVHDLWGAHGNVDALEAMLVESLKLPAYSTNSGLETLWALITAHGGDLLGVDGYGVATGTPADLVVHDAASPQWAILENRPPAYVLKDGVVVAADGELSDSHDWTFGPR